MPRPLSSRRATRHLQLVGRLVVLASLVTATRARAADPTTSECVSLNEHAGPLQKGGKLLEAHASFVRCSASTCPAVVRDDCAKHAVEVEAATPTIVFEARDGAGNDRSAVRLSVDGQARADKLTGVALDVNPGEHVFTFESAGLPPLEKHFVIHAGEKNRREQIVLGPVVAAPKPKPEPPPSPPESKPASSSPLKPVGITVGVVGIAGLGTGGVFGLLARSKWNQAVTDCGGGCSTGAFARTEATSAHNEAKIANIAFAAGGALTATGLILFLVAPHSGNGKEKASALGVAPFAGSGTVGVAMAGTLP
jgi:hypothetical protein